MTTTVKNFLRFDKDLPIPKVSKNRRAIFLSTCLFNNLPQTLVDWGFQTSSYRNLVLWESILSSATLHCCLVVHLRLHLHERPNFQTILAVPLFPKNAKSQNYFLGFCLQVNAFLSTAVFKFSLHMVKIIATIIWNFIYLKIQKRIRFLPLFVLK